jgi:hypothetical protein
MPAKTRPQVIGRVRKAPGVMSRPTMKADSKATVASAERATISQLKQDIRGFLDLVDEIMSEQSLESSDIEQRSVALRQRWGLS